MLDTSPVERLVVVTTGHVDVRVTFASGKSFDVTTVDAGRSRALRYWRAEVLCPLLRGDVRALPLDVGGAYADLEAESARIAEVCVASCMRPGSVLLLHQLELALVPELFRRAMPEMPSAFCVGPRFDPDVFTHLPRWRELVIGMLGADVVCLPTAVDRDRFRELVERIGFAVHDDVVRCAGHSTSLFIAGSPAVDVEGIRASAAAPAVVERAREIRASLPSHVQKLCIASVADDPDTGDDDATKPGVFIDASTRAAAAVERFLAADSGLAREVIVVTVATKENAVQDAERLAHFLAADVILADPFTCSAFVAARTAASEVGRQDGVVVSTASMLDDRAAAAGASTAMGAIVTNPFDLDETATALRAAVMMPLAEQHARMAALRATLPTAREHTSRIAAAVARTVKRGRESALLDEVARAAAAPHLHIVIDYDGTLAPLVTTPSQAIPDPAVLALLSAFAATEHTSVHIVSGRSIDDLERWLGALDVALYAEHGAHERRSRTSAWRRAAVPPWRDAAVALLADIARAAPSGAFVEEKLCAVAFHTRAVADGERAAVEARAAQELTSAFGKTVAVLRGDCVVEARDASWNKGRILWGLGLDEHHIVFAAGDDTTDDDLFRALPQDAVAVAVGARPRRARFRVANPLELRVLLLRLLAARRRRPS